MAVLPMSLEVSAPSEELEKAVNRVADGSEQIILTRGGKPVAVLVSVQDWERIPPDLSWQQRFDDVVARIQSRIPDGVTSEEMEADIREACDEVKRERLARG